MDKAIIQKNGCSIIIEMVDRFIQEQYLYHTIAEAKQLFREQYGDFKFVKGTVLTMD